MALNGMQWNCHRSLWRIGESSSTILPTPWLNRALFTLCSSPPATRCYHPQTLSTISGHWETNEPLPKDMLNKILNARHHLSGTAMLRQLYFGRLDMDLHVQTAPGMVVPGVRKHDDCGFDPMSVQHQVASTYVAAVAPGFVGCSACIIAALVLLLCLCQPRHSPAAAGRPVFGFVPSLVCRHGLALCCRVFQLQVG